MKEDKARTCELLAEVLRSTRIYYDLEYLEYLKLEYGPEYVIPHYEEGSGPRIDVTCDSCAALILDVVNALIR